MDTDMRSGAPAAAPVAAEVLDGLNDLLQLDHDAIGAYDVAIERLHDRDHAAQIAGFRRDHERHIQELHELITRFGGQPIDEPHRTAPLKRAMQRVGAMAGDTAALIAWRANELQVRTKYDSYAARAIEWPPEAKRLIDRNALDEERHHHWVVEVLQARGIGPDESLETGVATRVREAGRRLEHAADSLGHRARDAGERVRSRVAQGLDTAAERLDGLRPPSPDGGADRVANAAHRVAGGMHATADFVREGELDELRADFEGRVREHPLRTLLTMFAVGFAVGRILR